VLLERALDVDCAALDVREQAAREALGGRAQDGDVHRAE
jgi:hypothetical protein